MPYNCDFKEEIDKKEGERLNIGEELTVCADNTGDIIATYVIKDLRKEGEDKVLVKADLKGAEE